MVDNSIYIQYYHENFIDAGMNKIPAEQFPQYCFKAFCVLDAITFSRINDVADLDTVKQCVCEVSEVIYQYDTRIGIKSENNDGYSVTYDESDFGREKEIKRIAEIYLGSMGLLYSGL